MKLLNKVKSTFSHLVTLLGITLLAGSNFILKRQLARNNRPIFYDMSQYPELFELDKNFHNIKNELEQVMLKVDNIIRFHELDSRQTFLSDESDKTKNWRTFVLYCYGVKPEKNREACPKTVAILDKIPCLAQAFFSILEGGKSIPPHQGPYHGILRYHLALKIPIQNPPVIRIKDQTYTWKEGESVMFDDTWEHEVINHSEDPRVVLFISVVRKDLPLLLKFINYITISLVKGVHGPEIAEKFQLNG